MRHVLLSISGLSGVLFLSTQACVEVDSCSEYVNYMCDCHGDDDNVDCATLRATYDEASSELQDECSLALDDQEAEDFETSYVCGDGEDTQPPS